MEEGDGEGGGTYNWKRGSTQQRALRNVSIIAPNQQQQQVQRPGTPSSTLNVQDDGDLSRKSAATPPVRTTDPLKDDLRNRGTPSQEPLRLIEAIR